MEPATTHCNITLRLDMQTYDFLQQLRDVEHVNISSWVRGAIRAKAGLKDDTPKEVAKRKAG